MLNNTIAMSGPLILAAMAGYLSERSGIINIALEGKMLAGACGAALATTLWQNAWLALVAATLAAILMSLAHWLLTQRYRLDHIISGMAINVFSLGATNYLYTQFIVPRSNMDAGSLPGIELGAFWTVAFVAPLALSLYARYTRGGLHLLAVGNDPEKARMMGLQPEAIRFRSLLGAGVLTGIAGAAIYTNSGQFTDNMTAGRGYIALAALILGGWKPLPALAACVGFAFFQALQLQLQGTQVAGSQIPAEVFSSIPYVVTVIALGGLLGRSRPPAGLAQS